MAVRLVGSLLFCACEYYCEAMEDPDIRCKICNTAYTMRGPVLFSHNLTLLSAGFWLAAGVATAVDERNIGSILFPAPAPQVISWITFVFTILLFFGISYRFHKVLLAYIVYGVGLLLVALIAATCIQAQINDYSSKYISQSSFGCYGVFIGCALNAPCLVIVYHAYIKIRIANVSGDFDD